MTTALVVGCGSVGREAVRQLAATPTVERVLVTDADADAASALASDIGEKVVTTTWDPGERIPAAVSTVAVAVPGELDARIVERGIEGRVPVATCGEHPRSVGRLLDLHAAAVESGTTVVVGAGLAPGLSEVLARFAAGHLDEVEEVHVARYGAAGPASGRWRRRSARSPSRELLGGAWVEQRAATGRRLVDFPSPVGTQECRRAAAAVPRLLATTLPALATATFRSSLRRSDVLTGRVAPAEGGGSRLGGLVVDLRGRRGSAREVVTLGAVDHLAVVTGTVLAVAAAAAGGALPELGSEPGVGPASVLVEPVPFLAELAARGVRAAEFEGTDAR